MRGGGGEGGGGGGGGGGGRGALLRLNPSGKSGVSIVIPDYMNHPSTIITKPLRRLRVEITNRSKKNIRLRPKAQRLPMKARQLQGCYRWFVLHSILLSMQRLGEVSKHGA